MLLEHFGLLMCIFNEKECQKSKQNIQSKNCSEKESQRDPESRVGGRGGTPLEKTLYLPSGLYVVHVLPGGPAQKALALRLRSSKPAAGFTGHRLCRRPLQHLMTP